MIQIPSIGLPSVVDMRNVDMNVLCDWIETSVLFTGEDISQMRVADTLIEEERCEEQEVANLIVQDAWSELERRISLCGSSYGISINNEWARCVYSWSDRPAHAFCLLLSMSTKYDWWVKEFVILRLNSR